MAHRLLGVVYPYEGTVGQFNRRFLEWFHAQETRYADNFAIVSKLLLHGSEDELRSVATHLKQTASPQFVPLQEAKYAASVVAQLHEHDDKFTIAVLDILANIAMFNENRNDWQYWFQLTFAPGLVNENHVRAVDNVKRAETQMLKRAKIVVDKITKLEDGFK